MQIEELKDAEGKVKGTKVVLDFGALEALGYEMD